LFNIYIKLGDKTFFLASRYWTKYNLCNFISVLRFDRSCTRKYASGKKNWNNARHNHLFSHPVIFRVNQFFFWISFLFLLNYFSITTCYFTQSHFILPGHLQINFMFYYIFKLIYLKVRFSVNSLFTLSIDCNHSEVLDNIMCYCVYFLNFDITGQEFTILGKWPTWYTITLHKTFIIVMLYMFRVTLCSSSVGRIVLMQHRAQYSL